MHMNAQDTKQRTNNAQTARIKTSSGKPGGKPCHQKPFVHFPGRESHMHLISSQWTGMCWCFSINFVCCHCFPLASSSNLLQGSGLWIEAVKLDFDGFCTHLRLAPLKTGSRKKDKLAAEQERERQGQKRIRHVKKQGGKARQGVDSKSPWYPRCCWVNLSHVTKFLVIW